LFAQFAVAAYACPKLMPAGAPTEAPMAAPAAAQGETTLGGGTGSDCESMAAAPDASQANLCIEHCRFGQQSDQTASVTVPTPALTPLYGALLPADAEPAFHTTATSLNAFVAPSPPRTILHCRLLI
jgi:hypothetical protein